MDIQEITHQVENESIVVRQIIAYVISICPWHFITAALKRPFLILKMMV